MRANSRSSMRWRAATAVVALVLCSLPKVALADGGGNGRAVPVKWTVPAAEGMDDQRKEHAMSVRDDNAVSNPKIKIDWQIDGALDGDRIEDDRDVATVERSAGADAVNRGLTF